MIIGWVGLGNMGAPMAANLVKAGHVVRGFDLSEAAREHARQAGVDVAASLTDAVGEAQVVFTMLPAGAHVRSALLDDGGVLSLVQPGTRIVDSSTIDIATARELHETVAARGFPFLDAPVSGGVFGAEAGTLTFMIGGTDEDLDAVRELIEAMAGRIFHAGGAGAGQAAKMCNNLMLAVNTAGLCEAAVLADRLGLDHRIFHEIATTASGDSWAVRNWYPMPGVVETAAVNRDFEGGFGVNLMRKDVALALEAGEQTGVPLTTGKLVAGFLDQMVDAGYGSKDTASLVRLVDGTIAAED